MNPSDVAQTRRQIAAALAGPLKPPVRARLLATDAVLSGQPIGDVAAAARVLPNAVRKWLRVVSRDGIDATVEGWQADRRLRPGRIDIDPATLHELAAKERNPRVRKRMLALACVAEGMSTYDAEAKVGLNHWAITKRVKRFQREGVAAFQDKKIAGRPHKSSVEPRSKPVPCKRKPNVKEPPAAALGVRSARGRPRKLNGAQLEELRDYVVKRPETSFWRLHRLVWNRFRVRHSHASLKRLLENVFGIRWTGANKKLGEGLSLAELRDALADTTDWRTRKRLKALIQLAKGSEPDTVARSNYVVVETLRKWAKRYGRYGIEGLRLRTSATGGDRNSRAGHAAS